ncbi:hypothetical protein [Methylobacter tundripaludum]|uniref:hypothetical protein n=1 Tax=Methylobacter tundripaludum TaxID=173365 RepID=UPI0004DF4FE7|nr:hypothetical protein [Methylobacter tundripaludum]
MIEQNKATAPDSSAIGTMKSYELINTPLKPAPVQLVAQVANKLKDIGFEIVTGQFGDNPAITVKATIATRQLESVYIGQHSDKDGKMYRTYAAGVDGVKVIWHRLKPMLEMH